jgi:hypothetical protein
MKKLVIAVDYSTKPHEGNPHTVFYEAIRKQRRFTGAVYYTLGQRLGKSFGSYYGGGHDVPVVFNRDSHLFRMRSYLRSLPDNIMS